ncbi:Hsp20/alpha crystallin family protein [Flavobacterium sp. GT3R68]|uniref:Hsp20/alpha crystallin family protein n=1 Tax=Flavobacterium sp. GT3R68 TaxID=2594437 RepID=UPI000F8672F2|nr:Hsp20/alpha crystallin family protein [Flavobacterium sp. GT3R68]RTY94962.1 Hsp20/alpha crystallin family protein [Flavobacterium sp. GSN2]TRW91766.1 Hsp20/alpha crystallin family protein [Flavobacterium sp. GT3R68]
METLLKRNGLSSPVNTLIEDFFSKDIFDWADKNFAAVGANLPSVNLKETDNSLEIEMAVPGMKKEDFKVEIDNNMLIISSEREEEKEENRKKDNYVRKEFNYRSFYRSFFLPESIDENKIDANYIDGILHVVVAKKLIDKKKSPKTILMK